VQADPADLEARFELANLLALQKDYAPAIAHLLEIVRRDRSFREDGARKTLIQLFNLLGADNDMVRTARSELATALNR
jgi:putative thioredoxin